MIFRYCLQPNISINPRPRIPSAVWRLICYRNINLIFSLHEKFCNVNFKRCIAIFPLSRLLFIDIDSAIHINPIKSENHKLTAAFLLMMKLLSIPSTSIFVQIPTLVNQPVMRNSYGIKFILTLHHLV